MRVPDRLTLLLAVSALAFSASACNAQAGVDPTLCHSTTARANIPANFAVNACFDGSHLTLEDSTNYVLEVATAGDVGRPQRKEIDYGLAADAERLHASGNPGIFLPGDTLIFPVGSGAGTVALTHAPDNGFYAIATTIAGFFPGKPAAVVGAFTGLVAELDDDYFEYAKCVVGKNWLGQLGCQAQRSWNVTYAVGRAVVNGTASGIVAAVLAPSEWAKWFQATVEQASPLISAAKVITIAAALPNGQPPSAPTSRTSRGATTTSSSVPALTSGVPTCTHWLQLPRPTRLAAVARMQAAHHDRYPLLVAYGSVRLFCAVYPDHTIDGVYDGNL